MGVSSGKAESSGDRSELAMVSKSIQKCQPKPWLWMNLQGRLWGVLRISQERNVGNTRMVSKKTNSESCYCRQGKRVSSMREGSTVLDSVVDVVMYYPDPTSGIKMYFKQLL